VNYLSSFTCLHVVPNFYTGFLLQSTIEDILKNVSAGFVHIMKVHGTQNCQALKRKWIYSSNGNVNLKMLKMAKWYFKCHDVWSSDVHEPM